MRRAGPPCVDRWPEWAEPAEAVCPLWWTLGQDRSHLQVREGRNASQAGLLLPPQTSQSDVLWSVAHCDVTIKAGGQPGGRGAMCRTPSRVIPNTSSSPHAHAPINTAAHPPLPKHILQSHCTLPRSVPHQPPCTYVHFATSAP